MLIYGYRGKASMNSTRFTDKNFFVLCMYHSIKRRNSGWYMDRARIGIRQVYNTMKTFEKFNNYLIDAYNTEEKPLKLELAFLDNYLKENNDIISSPCVDMNGICSYIYKKLSKWYDRLTDSIDNLDNVKWEVVKEMKYFEKMGLFHIASINQQKNYDDFIYDDNSFYQKGVDILNNTNIQVETKIKKIYLSDNKNDLYQKKSVDYLKERIIKASLLTYNNGNKPSESEFKKFKAYVDKRVKPNKSKNDLNYRIESLYNHIISLYSDYMELTEIIRDDNKEITQAN